MIINAVQYGSKTTDPIIVYDGSAGAVWAEPALAWETANASGSKFSDYAKLEVSSAAVSVTKTDDVYDITLPLLSGEYTSGRSTMTSYTLGTVKLQSIGFTTNPVITAMRDDGFRGTVTLKGLLVITDSSGSYIVTYSTVALVKQVPATFTYTITDSQMTVKANVESSTSMACAYTSNAELRVPGLIVQSIDIASN